MSKPTRRQKRLRTSLLFTAGVSMLALSGSLLSEHAASVSEVREISAPLVADIPRFERRLALLTDQIELAELHDATHTGSQEEHINVFVLPEELDFDRLLAAFDVVETELKSQGLLTEISDIALSDPVASSEEGLEERTLSINFAAHEDGAHAILSLVKFAGLLTVGDLLSTSEQRLLLQKTEAENPAGVIAMEQFLSTELLSYARDAKTYEAQLMRSFSSPSFVKTLQDTLQSSSMRDARRVLGGEVGASLQRSGLWPLPLMALGEVEVRAGGASKWFVLSVEIKVYSRIQAL